MNVSALQREKDDIVFKQKKYVSALYRKECQCFVQRKEVSVLYRKGMPVFCTEGESQWFVQKRNVSFLYRKGDDSDLMQKKDGMSVFICRDVCVCNGKGMAVFLCRDVSVCNG